MVYQSKSLFGRAAGGPRAGCGFDLWYTTATLAPAAMIPLSRRVAPLLSVFLAACVALPGRAAEAPVRAVPPRAEKLLVTEAGQPAEYRYTAFPVALRVGPDEVWIVYKAGKTHATDAGAALEVVRHSLAGGTTELIQRLPAPPPKLYQMGEITRLPDGTIAIYVDVQAVGWDGRHYRSGAEVFRWDETRRAFGPPEALPTVAGVRYGYPFEFVSAGRTTWQLVMKFGYMQGGRWGVDVLRSDDAGRSWSFVRDLTEEFGRIPANESGFARHGDGWIVTTRGYDRIARLHRTDADFKLLRQRDLTGHTPYIQNLIGRPRLLIRDGKGYLLGRNWTEPNPTAKGAAAKPMQLCLIRFDLETLLPEACVILDNADHRRVTDGYYAVAEFSGAGTDELMHIITYRGIAGAPPAIVRLDFRWADVK